MMWSFGMLRSVFEYELNEDRMEALIDALHRFDGDEQLVDQAPQFVFSLGGLFQYEQVEKVN